MNQGGCGSCYTFAAAQVTADRTNALNNGTTVLSPQSMLSCNQNFQASLPTGTPDATWSGTQGCDGGQTIDMFDFIKLNGVATCTKTGDCTEQVQGCDGCDTGCAPYTAGWLDNGTLCDNEETYAGNCNMPTCSAFSSCANYTFSGEPSCVPHDDHVLGFSTVGDIQRELREGGTVAVGIKVWDNFYQFWSKNPKAVWKNSTEPAYDQLFPGGHAVVLVGWGTSADGVNYWKVIAPAAPCCFVLR
jgi:cathepsin B